MEKPPKPILEHLLIERVQVGVDTPRRTIYLFGEVDDRMAHRFMVAMDSMESIVKRAQEHSIRIIMDSVGGDEDHGYAIYDRIMQCPFKITIEGYGTISSIAAAIFQAAEVRQMSPNCELMIHNGSVPVPEVDGTVQQDKIVSMAEVIKRNGQKYYNILASRCNLTMEDIVDACGKETFYSAQEAVDVGFADSIMTPAKKFERLNVKPTKKKGKR